MEGRRRPARHRPRDRARRDAGALQEDRPLSLAHCAAAECAVPARTAWRFLTDGKALGRWALGSFDTRRVGPNLWRGTSLFDGKALFVRPVGDAKRLIVDYYVGADRKKLTPRIMARVVSIKTNHSLVVLVAWRDPGMDDERWARLVACHEVEVRLIQALLK